MLKALSNVSQARKKMWDQVWQLLACIKNSYLQFPVFAEGNLKHFQFEMQQCNRRTVLTLKILCLEFTILVVCNLRIFSTTNDHS